MAQLAIKGHATRGREVIELLEMLGGVNKFASDGKVIAMADNSEAYYAIDKISKFIYIIGKSNDSPDAVDWKTFTLEEFLEKFPYKVGDKVTHNMGILMTVVHMCWDDECSVIRYNIQSPVDNNYKLKAMLAEHLQPYKEETMEERENSVVVNIEHKQLKVHSLRFDKTQLVINDEYELNQEGDAYYIVRKKQQYPKTYEECCDNIPLSDCVKIARMLPYKLALLLENFSKLLICRDAYWKIAGEEMGLGKPWKPDWNNNDYKFIIQTYGNKVGCWSVVETHRIFSFPTEKMRDAFFENFGGLIEQCKELL